MGSETPAVGRAEFVPYQTPEVLTPTEAADLLRVEVAVVESLAASHQLPARMIAGSWRFSRAAILRWLDHHGEPSQTSQSPHPGPVDAEPRTER
jgi:excisionase family DNA binding protein